MTRESHSWPEEEFLVPLIPLASPLHDPTSVERVWDRTESSLSEEHFNFLRSFAILMEPLQLPPPAPLAVLFLMTGGTEFIGASYEAEEYLLLVHPSMNSLPAALELRTFLAARGKSVRIYSLEELKQALPRRFKAWRTYRRFVHSRLAVIGSPAPWLVGSRLTPDQAGRRWGMEILELDLKKIRALLPPEWLEERLDWLAVPRRGVEAEDLPPALNFASSLLSFAREAGIDGLALSCFELLEERGVSGCLALSLLNDLGITAACEGDLLSLLTMHLLSLVSDQVVFMGNPSWVEHGQILLAHCTVATRLVDRLVLRPHFESGKSVALEGHLPPGLYTLAKISPDLKGIFFALAHLIRREVSEHLCRTQALLQLEEAEDIKRLPLANHLLLAPGDLIPPLEELLSLLGLRRISGRE